MGYGYHDCDDATDTACSGKENHNYVYEIVYEGNDYTSQNKTQPRTEAMHFPISLVNVHGYTGHIQLYQIRLSPSKAEKSNTSAKSLLGVMIKNTQTEQNSVSRDT